MGRGKEGREMEGNGEDERGIEIREVNRREVKEIKKVRGDMLRMFDSSGAPPSVLGWQTLEKN